MAQSASLTGVERHFNESEIIVSKTDLKGRLTYTNRLFMTISDYSEKELLGAPHSIIRHPDMPRCVFKLLWQAIESGREVFAYVVNRCKNGDHYWVLAHVTPSFDSAGKVVGYHSNRRVPNRRILDGTVIPLYRSLLAEENRHDSRKDGMQMASDAFTQQLQAKGLSYDEWIFSL